MEKQQETGVWSTVKPELEAGGAGEAVRHIQPAMRRGGSQELVRNNTVCFLLIPPRIAAALFQLNMRGYKLYHNGLYKPAEKREHPQHKTNIQSTKNTAGSDLLEEII